MGFNPTQNLKDLHKDPNESLLLFTLNSPLVKSSSAVSNEINRSVLSYKENCSPSLYECTSQRAN